MKILSLALTLALSVASETEALLVAADDASSTAYNSGFNTGTNGGFGFGAWTVNRDNGDGSGGGFIGNNADTNVAGESFGVFGNGGGVGQAFRSLNTPLTVLGTFSLTMDNGSVGTGGTVGFSLRNSSGNNLFEYYFVGGQTNYTVNGLNLSGTIPGFTSGGMALTLTLVDANSFSLTIDRLSNGIGVDNTVTGDLLANSNQAISQVRLFNANGGPDVFFNSLSVTAIPEVSPALALPLTAMVVTTLQTLTSRRRDSDD